MLPIDYAFIALILAIILYIINDDQGGGRRGRLPAAIGA
jgi:hypothetical protein